MTVFKAIKDLAQGKTPTFSKRDSRWPRLRKAYLKTHGECVVCGSTKRLEVHHVLPFHLYPERELDLTNLVTLCESSKRGFNCHLFVGHMGSYRTYNKQIVATVKFVQETFGSDSTFGSRQTTEQV